MENSLIKSSTTGTIRKTDTYINQCDVNKKKIKQKKIKTKNEVKMDKNDERKSINNRNSRSGNNDDNNKEQMIKGGKDNNNINNHHIIKENGCNSSEVVTNNNNHNNNCNGHRTPSPTPPPSPSSSPLQQQSPADVITPSPTMVETETPPSSSSSQSPSSNSNNDQCANNGDIVTVEGDDKDDKVVVKESTTETTPKQPNISANTTTTTNIGCELLLGDEIINYKEYESELQMPDIMHLIQKDLSEPYSIYTYRYFIHNWPKLCFLALNNNGKCVGAIVCKLDMHRDVKRGYIAMLAVDKNYRKLKIGTNLVQKAIQAMLNDNADEVVLETEITNIPALKLYENLGFVRDKRLFHYYLNGVDALRLKLWFR